MSRRLVDPGYHPIASHTARDAQEAAERMKAWADAHPESVARDLSPSSLLNLARVALDLRPR